MFRRRRRRRRRRRGDQERLAAEPGLEAEEASAGPEEGSDRAGDAASFEEGQQAFGRRRRRSRHRRAELVGEAGSERPQGDPGLRQRPGNGSADGEPPYGRQRRDRPQDGGPESRPPRRDFGGRREDKLPRRKQPFSGRPDESWEPNFNRKGVAPEPPGPNPMHNSGMLVGEHRDRWLLVDRRGRPVRRPWLSEDDRNQRLFGNQLAPEARRQDDERRWRAGEGLLGRKNGSYAVEPTRRHHWRHGNDRDDAALAQGSSGKRRPRRRRSRPPGGQEGPA